MESIWKVSKSIGKGLQRTRKVQVKCWQSTEKYWEGFGKVHETTWNPGTLVPGVLALWYLATWVWHTGWMYNLKNLKFGFSQENIDKINFS